MSGPDGDGEGGSVPVLPSDEELAAMRYEELVATLERLTRRMADNEVGIEEAADLYERARAIHRMASERLDAIRKRIDELEAEG